MTEKKFPKKYNHDFEEQIYEEWNQKGYFSPEKLEEIKGNLKDRFMISMPPPNVTGVLHLGHALMLSIEDAMVRYARMKGKKTLWIPGTDHAGIATQVVVEKKLAKEEGKTRHDLGREKFLEKVWEWVRFSRSTIISQIKKMGASCDWSREQFTLSEKLSRAVRKSFSNLYKKGKIYQGEYIVNWCPRCQTVLSDIEVKYIPEKGKLYYIKYFVEGKGQAITVATTRPETIFADVAIAVNPRDKRYKKWIGKNVYIPIVNRPIPVIADEEVDPAFGTGALKITPTHDPDDFEIGKKHGLPMDRFAIDWEGKFTELAPDFLVGKPVEEVFDNLIQVLDEIGNLEKIEDYEHNVPHCDRCGTIVQPMVSKQWFVDVKEFAQKSIEAVKKGDTKILPERFNKTFFDWLENIRPWCISRQLRWGHRIPVWTCKKGHINVFDDQQILNNWLDVDQKSDIILSLIIFNLIADSRLKNPFNIEELIKLLTTPSLTPQEGRVVDVYLKVYRQMLQELSIDEKTKNKLSSEIKKIESIFDLENEKNLIKAGEKLVDILENSYLIEKVGDKYRFTLICQECGDKDLRQEEDVLDTWFSSALWPFSVLGWPENTDDLKEYYPNDVLETGYDILFFRVARMMMMGFANMNEEPFKNVYLHGLVRDAKGEKMSKSKGNAVDPLKVIEKYGADSLRLALVRGVTPGNDIKYSDEKVEGNWKFLNKLWNASRFVYLNVNQEGNIKFEYDLLYEDIKNNVEELGEFDKWILAELDELINQVEKYMDKFMLGEAINKIVDFAWSLYCDWFIEISKIEKSELTLKILVYVLGTIYKLLHPFAPFVTEKLWHLVGFDGDLIVQDYPKPIGGLQKSVKINLFIDLVGEFRKLRNKLGLKPHETVDVVIQVNEDYIKFLSDNINLLKTLIKADNVLLDSGKSEGIFEGYDVSVVYDIKLGLKGNKKLSKSEQIEILEKKLKEEKQFLQTLKNILSNEEFLKNAPKKVIEQKRKKMEEVEKKILKLEVELKKLKAL